MNAFLLDPPFLSFSELCPLHLTATLNVMAYEPVGHNIKGPRVSVEDALSIQYDAGSYSNSLDDSRDHDGEDGVKDNKDTSHETRVQKWPSRSQKVATITPLKVLIMVFDVVLASTPIMFLGEYHQSWHVFIPPLRTGSGHMK